jgi:hypothetical protein
MTNDAFHKRWGWGARGNPTDASSGPWIRDFDRIFAQLAIVTAPWYVRLWRRVRNAVRRFLGLS